MTNNTKLGGLFYPVQDQNGKDIAFDSLFIPYIYREIYFENVYDEVLNNQKDLVIVDVGANIGVTVDHFRKFSKQVYGIEPSPEHFEALSKNKEFNNWENVTISNVALADKDGEMDFAQSSNNRTTNALVDKETNKGVGPGWYDTFLKVKTQSIDSYFTEHNITHVDFMKFDPEGAEELILYSEGFKKVAPMIKAIECEFHHGDWINIVKFLESLGYQAKRYDSSAIIVLFQRP